MQKKFDKYTNFYSEKQKASLKKAIDFVIDRHKTKVKSLLKLSKVAIKSSLKSKSISSIQKLNLPRNLEYYVKNTYTLHENVYHDLIKFD
jgi:hypothetical protein